ncbi:MAG: hypothetical protein CME60_00720 [Halobacteriovoraceae bacterium]|nr:hypothetical protein [Halobacteriovoraceae bacterium]
MSKKLSLFIFIFALSLLFDGGLLAKGPGHYSEAADIFEFIDHASGWHEKSDQGYRTVLLREGKLTSAQEQLLSRYAKLRKKEYENSSIQSKMIKEDDTFGNIPFGYDHFSRSFYSSNTIREALLNLKKEGVPAEDIQFLNELYKSFAPKLKPFIKESAQFAVKLIEFNKQWKYSGRDRALKLTKGFVLGKKGRKWNLTMLPVWSPGTVLPSVDIRGEFLILRYNPLTQTENWDYTDILKKAVAAVFYAQDLEQRENLSKLFKLKCNGREYEFQEATQIAFGAMLPRYIKTKRKFNLYERWSSKVFVDVYAKLLFPLMEENIKNKGTFSGFFMEQSSFLCRQLHQLAIRP